MSITFTSCYIIKLENFILFREKNKLELNK